MRGADAVIQNRLIVGRGMRAALFDELDRLEEEMGGALAPYGVELGEEASVGPKLDAVLGERGAEEVAAELFGAGAIVRWHPDVGVEVAAVEGGRGGTAKGGRAQIRLAAEAAGGGAGAGGPGATRPWTEAPARPARTGEAPVSGSVGVLSSFRLELGTDEQPPDPGADGGEADRTTRC